MLDFLNPELIAKVVAILVIINVVLSAASAALEKLQIIIPGDTDSKILAKIKAVSAFLQKIIDLVSANRAH